MFPKDTSDTTLSIVLFLSASVWGLYWVPLHMIEDLGVPGAWSVALFNACPLLALIPWMIARRDLWAIMPGPALTAAVFSGLGLAFYASGLVAGSVVRTTLLFYLTPVWSTLIGILWLGERMSLARWAAIALGLLGMLVLLGPQDLLEGSLNTGDALGLASGVSWAIGASVLKRYPGIPVLSATAYQFAAAGLASSAFALFFFATPLPAPEAIFAAAPIAVLGSVLVMLPTVYMIFEIQQRLFPGRAGILMMSEVLVAIVSAALFLPDEWLTAVQWLGALAIVLAAFVEVLGAPSQTSAETKPARSSV